MWLSSKVLTPPIYTKRLASDYFVWSDCVSSDVFVVDVERKTWSVLTGHLATVRSVTFVPLDDKLPNDGDPRSASTDSPVFVVSAGEDCMLKLWATTGNNALDSGEKALLGSWVVGKSVTRMTIVDKNLVFLDGQGQLNVCSMTASILPFVEQQITTCELDLLKKPKKTPEPSQELEGDGRMDEDDASQGGSEDEAGPDDYLLEDVIPSKRGRAKKHKYSAESDDSDEVFGKQASNDEEDKKREYRGFSPWKHPLIRPHYTDPVNNSADKASDLDALGKLMSPATIYGTSNILAWHPEVGMAVCRRVPQSIPNNDDSTMPQYSTAVEVEFVDRRAYRPLRIPIAANEQMDRNGIPAGASLQPHGLLINCRSTVQFHPLHPHRNPRNPTGDEWVLERLESPCTVCALSETCMAFVCEDGKMHVVSLHGVPMGTWYLGKSTVVGLTTVCGRDDFFLTVSFIADGLEGGHLKFNVEGIPDLPVSPEAHVVWMGRNNRGGGDALTVMMSDGQLLACPINNSRAQRHPAGWMVLHTGLHCWPSHIDRWCSRLFALVPFPQHSPHVGCVEVGYWNAPVSNAVALEEIPLVMPLPHHKLAGHDPHALSISLAHKHLIKDADKAKADTIDHEASMKDRKKLENLADKHLLMSIQHAMKEDDAERACQLALLALQPTKTVNLAVQLAVAAQLRSLAERLRSQLTITHGDDKENYSLPDDTHNSSGDLNDARHFLTREEHRKRLNLHRDQIQVHRENKTHKTTGKESIVLAAQDIQPNNHLSSLAASHAHTESITHIEDGEQDSFGDDASTQLLTAPGANSSNVGDFRGLLSKLSGR